MKIRTLRAEVKKFNAELVTGKIKEVEVVANDSSVVMSENLVETQEKGGEM